MTKISPSILACDFARLGEEIESIRLGGAEMAHLDVMDGIFVTNISFGLPVIESIRKSTSMFLDVHLMITKPERYIERFIDAGADLVTFHIEATDCPDKCTYAALSDGKHKIDFDRIVEVMKETGHDLPSLYKETSTGGIAKIDINKRRGFKKIFDTLHNINKKHN